MKDENTFKGKKSHNPHGIDLSYLAVKLIQTNTNLGVNPYASNSYANIKQKQIYEINLNYTI